MPPSDSTHPFYHSFISFLHTVFIHIDAHARIHAHLPSSSSSWHTKIGEIDDFCFKNAWIWGQVLRPLLCTPTSCLAHTQCITIRMDTVCLVHWVHATGQMGRVHWSSYITYTTVDPDVTKLVLKPFAAFHTWALRTLVAPNLCSWKSLCAQDAFGCTRTMRK